MTQLLEKAFEKATSLPPELQDEFGALFMAEMESELRWNELFEQSQDELAGMGQVAMEEYRAGRTTGLDKILAL